jgi:hypothetical protein
MLTFLSIVVGLQDEVRKGNGFILRTDGTVEDYNPDAESKVYNFNELKTKCGMDLAQILSLNNHGMLVCDEEAMFTGKAVNPLATMLFRLAYNDNSLGVIGDCVYCPSNAIN